MNLFSYGEGIRDAELARRSYHGSLAPPAPPPFSLPTLVEVEGEYLPLGLACLVLFFCLAWFCAGLYVRCMLGWLGEPPPAGRGAVSSAPEAEPAPPADVAAPAPLAPWHPHLLDTSQPRSDAPGRTVGPGATSNFIRRAGNFFRRAPDPDPPLREIPLQPRGADRPAERAGELGQGAVRRPGSLALLNPRR